MINFKRKIIGILIAFLKMVKIIIKVIYLKKKCGIQQVYKFYYYNKNLVKEILYVLIHIYHLIKIEDMLN